MMPSYSPVAGFFWMKFFQGATPTRRTFYFVILSITDSALAGPEKNADAMSTAMQRTHALLIVHLQCDRIVFVVMVSPSCCEGERLRAVQARR